MKTRYVAEAFKAMEVVHDLDADVPGAAVPEWLLAPFETPLLHTGICKEDSGITIPPLEARTRMNGTKR